MPQHLNLKGKAVRWYGNAPHFLIGLVITLGAAAVAGQTPSPTPVVEGDYNVTSSIELGVRGLDVNGSHEKFKSDLNYRSGFRVFDSSFLIENNGTGTRIFDTAQVNSSGWGGDPGGFFRASIEKTGIYKLESNIRRVRFFNSLNNHALNEHNADTRHNFGDVDLTIFPESRDLRFRLGYSFSTLSGTGGFTTRAYGDEFPVTSYAGSHSNDFRSGIEGNLIGFDLSLSYGYRRFEDNARYTLLAPHPGNNPANNARLATFDRHMPVDGESHNALFSVHRTFAKRLDFTGRFIYSETDTRFTLNEEVTGRDNSNNQVVLDRFAVSGDAKRPQGRGDLGVTYMVTDKFRISNTLTYDQFNISGGNLFAEALFSLTPAGGTRPTVFTNTTSHRITSYRRTSNLFEGDYQFNNRFGFNIGYRFTHRSVALDTFDRNFAQASPTINSEEFENSTNTVIAGVKVKPMKNWSIFGDIEHGKADNVFTRLSNAKFTNFRVRSRMSFGRFAVNLSVISKDNETPGRAILFPAADFTAKTTSRTFSGNVDWSPSDMFTFSGGYTYQHLTSVTPIVVPAGGYRNGLSQYFVRDHSLYFDVSAKPLKHLSIYAAYRINDDRGQGDVISTLPEQIFSSYPMRFQSPEIRLVMRLTRNVDWNVGYQYYDYKEKLQSSQDYRAHLPYTSLRIYFGKGAADR